jgi:hypothetical protein
MQHRWTTDSLYERCAPEPMSGCWLWEGYARHITPNYLQPEGSYKGKKLRVAKIAWLLHNGEIPSGMHVLHRCNNSLCVNPAHLYLGSHQQNMRDLKCSDRARNGHTKVTIEHLNAVRKLRADGETVASCAQHLGITAKAMSRLFNGRSERR